jgi:hypothetical protein
MKNRRHSSWLWRQRWRVICGGATLGAVTKVGWGTRIECDSQVIDAAAGPTQWLPLATSACSGSLLLETMSTTLSVQSFLSENYRTVWWFFQFFFLIMVVF